MNIFSILGLILAIFVLLTGLKLSSDDIKIFLDYPSLFIVCGGTLAATAISFQLDRILVLVKTFFKIIFNKNVIKYSELIVEIMKIGDAYRKGTSMDSLSPRAKDEFLKEGLTLISDGILKKEQIVKILEDRVENMDHDRREEANKIKVVAKYAPAFGMMGTTIGMVVLLANLGGEDAIKTIGPAMGVCLITTLYGVILANLAFLPVAENLLNHAKDLYIKDSIVIEGIKLIMEKENPVIVAEELNSYLKPKDRLNWKEVIGK